MFKLGWITNFSYFSSEHELLLIISQKVIVTFYFGKRLKTRDKLHPSSNTNELLRVCSSNPSWHQAITGNKAVRSNSSEKFGFDTSLSFKFLAWKKGFKTYSGVSTCSPQATCVPRQLQVQPNRMFVDDIMCGDVKTGQPCKLSLLWSIFLFNLTCCTRNIQFLSYKWTKMTNLIYT